MELKDFPVFTGMNSTQIENFSSAAEPVEVGAGEKLLAQGEAGTKIYFLTKGKVKVHVTSGAKEEDLATLRAPCVLGEIELLTGGNYAAHATSDEPCQGIVMATAIFQQRLTDGDPAALKVAYNIAKALAHRLSAMDAKVIEIMAATSSDAPTELNQLKEKLFGEWSV